MKVSMISTLIQRVRTWRDRRHWAATHLEWLRTLVHGDSRWLANDPVARAITERYEAALAEDWYTRVHEDVSGLRARLGLDPHSPSAPIQPQASAKDEKTFHAALQRVGTALGLPPGSDITRACVPAIEALRASRAAPGPVTQAWTHGIPMMQQSVLLSAIRGPDGLAKYGGGAKMLLRWLRRCVLLSAMDGKVLADPIEANGGSFTGPSLDGPDEEDHWSDRMQEHVNDYLRQVDALPHHFQMHFLHAAEIIGYKHPDAQIRLFWNRLYLRLVNDFHLWPETEEQMDSRLGDSRRGWLERADPATIA